jgi:hypothetical protein
MRSIFDVESTLDELKEELAEVLPGADQAMPLCHYTTPEGLLGIVDTKSIWATHYGHPNDREELAAGKEIISAEISRLAKASKWF